MLFYIYFIKERQWDSLEPCGPHQRFPCGSYPASHRREVTSHQIYVEWINVSSRFSAHCIVQVWVCEQPSYLKVSHCLGFSMSILSSTFSVRPLRSILGTMLVRMCE